MTHKLVCIGGVGNQLFILARALSSDCQEVEVYKLSDVQKVMLRAWGWKIHNDWISIDLLARDLNIKIKVLPFVAFLSIALRTIVRKLFRQPVQEKALTDVEGWDLGYFHTSCSTKKTAMLQVADAVKKQLSLRLLNVVEEYCVVHYRQGDMPKIFTLSNRQVEDFVCENLHSKVYVISPDLEEFENDNVVSVASGDEVDDLNLIRNSHKILMGSSTFCFWSLLTSEKNESQTILIKAGYHLADNLRRHGFNVYEID